MANLPNRNLILSTIKFWSGDSDYKLISKSENLVYKFERNGNSYILRLVNNSKRKINFLYGEIEALQNYLKYGVKVCKPIKSDSNSYIHIVTDERNITYNATVFEYISGIPIVIEKGLNLTKSLFYSWGQLLAQIHNVGNNFKTVISRPNKSEMYHQMWKTYNEVLDDELLNFIVSELNWLSRMPKSEYSFGLIHGDFAVNNLIKASDGLYAIDFDSSYFDYFIIDVALAIRSILNFSWRVKPTMYASNISKYIINFLQGYNSIIELKHMRIHSINRIIKLLDLFEKLAIHGKHPRNKGIKFKNKHWLNEPNNTLPFDIGREAEKIFLSESITYI